MSTGQRYPAPEARAAANRLIPLLADACERIEIAGSLRRGRAEVGDIELVALPVEADALNTLTAQLLDAGAIQQKLYGAGQKTRWGQKLRGFWFEEFPVELSVADQYNYGRLLWLRTGPDNDADRANTWLQTRIKNDAPFQTNDGYLWLKDRKLLIRDEQTFFELCGLPWIAPEQRTIANYKQMFGAHISHRWPDPAAFIPHEIDVYTGQASCPDEAALDITIKSAGSEGQLLAPTWEMVNAYKGGQMSADAYKQAYVNLLRSRWRSEAPRFEALLRSRQRLILTCHCAEGQFCHRLLAVDILARIAAFHRIALHRCGEWQPVPQQTTLL